MWKHQSGWCVFPLCPLETQPAALALTDSTGLQCSHATPASCTAARRSVPAVVAVANPLQMGGLRGAQVLPLMDSPSRFQVSPLLFLHHLHGLHRAPPAHHFHARYAFEGAEGVREERLPVRIGLGGSGRGRVGPLQLGSVPFRYPPADRPDVVRDVHLVRGPGNGKHVLL